MRIFISLIHICILCLISFAPSEAIAQKPHFRYLNENDGLDNNIINDIVQDEDGYIWIGTEDGLFRYDGRSFDVYRHSFTDENSLPSNAVESVHWTSQGLVVLTAKGVVSYEPETDGFSKSNFANSNSHRFDAVYATSTVGDSLFYAVAGDGIWFDTSNGIINLRNQNNAAQIDSLYLSTAGATNEYVWLGSWYNGLYRLEASDLKVDKVAEVIESRVYSASSDQFETTWVTTNGNVYYQISGQDFNAVPGIDPDDYLAVHLTESELMIGSRSQGLIVFSIDRGERTIEFTNRTIYGPSKDGKGVSSRTISKIFRDDTGGYWLGTHNGGISYFHPDKTGVMLETRKSEELNGLSYESVWGMTLDKNGLLWVGTDGNGIDIYDPVSTKFDRWSWLNDALSDNAILSMLEDRRGTMWIGTYQGGVMSVDRTKRQLKYHLLESNTDVRSIYQANNGDLYLGTNGQGLKQYDHESSSFVSLPGLEGLDIRSIKESDNGILWLGTYGQGLLRYHLQSQSIKSYSWNTSEEDYTPIIHTMLKQDNFLWIGTKYIGLLKFDITTEQFTRYGEDEGLINNTIRAIVPDIHGSLWISTNTGISRFEKANTRFRNYSRQAGFGAAQFNDNSAVTLPTGEIILGGIHGFNRFSPEELMADGILPPVLLKQLTINNISDGSSQKIFDPELIQHLELANEQKSIELEFAVLAYPSNSAYEVEVMLDGYDKSWQKAGEDLSLSYRNLPPGNYRLSYRISGAELSNSTQSLLIIVNYPWYRQWYAYLIYISLLALILYLVIIYSNRQVRLKEKLGYEHQLRIQEKVEHEQKVRFFTNFSHELRTPLTLISNPVNDLIARFDNSNEQLHLLKIIRRNGRQMMKLVNRLLEFRKVELEHNSLKVACYDINVLVQEEIEAFQYQANDSKIRFHLKTTSNLMVWLDIEKLQLVLNNLLTNALKYSPPSGNIWIELSASDDQLNLYVSDDGEGVKAGELENIFKPFYQSDNSTKVGGTGIGLSLCKNLIELHGGAISGSVNDHGGLTVHLSIPISKEHYETLDDVVFVESDGTNIPEEIDELVEEITEGDSINDKIMLIADDNRDIGEYLVGLFKSHYKVMYAVDGIDARNKINDTLPDIILSDIMMPGLDGLELCKMVKSQESTSHIPILLLTAKDSDRDKMQGYQFGADDYITKPFQSDMVIARVNSLIQSRELLRKSLGQQQIDPNTPIKDIEESEELQFLKKAERLVFECTTDDGISVPLLAKELGYSRTSLYRKIKALTDQSINQFIRSVKMKKAAEMLSSQDVTVSEVAFTLGYTDLKYFRSCFKDQYNTLPSDYQKQNYNSEVDIEAIKSALKIDRNFT